MNDVHWGDMMTHEDLLAKREKQLNKANAKLEVVGIITSDMKNTADDPLCDSCNPRLLLRQFAERLEALAESEADDGDN